MYPFSIEPPSMLYISRLIWDDWEDGQRVYFWFDGLFYLLEWQQSTIDDFKDSTEYYGKLTDRVPDGYFGDRAERILYGPSIQYQETYEDEDEAEKRVKELEKIERDQTSSRRLNDIYWDDLDWDDEGKPISWSVEWSEQPILVENIWTNSENSISDFPYWEPSETLLQNFEGETADQEQLIKSLVSGWKALEGFGHDWILVYIVAKVFADSAFEDGEELGEAALGGVTKVTRYISPWDAAVSLTHNILKLPEKVRERFLRPFSTDDAFFDSAAEVAAQAVMDAEEATEEAGESLIGEPWPEYLVLMREVLFWLVTYCNYARLDELQPDRIEEVNPNTYQVSVDVVCTADIHNLQRIIEQRLFRDLRRFEGISASTEISREGDEVVLTLLIKDEMLEVAYEIILYVFDADERLFLGDESVEIPIPERRGPIVIQSRIEDVMRERGYRLRL